MKKIIILICIFLCCTAYAEDYEIGYVICKPNDYVNMREHASRKGEPLGRLEIGDKVYLDGKEKNGFYHCVDVGFEMNEGWVYKGYIVFDEPVFINQHATIVSKGRLAVRNQINGKRIKWLKPMSSVTVYYMTEEWAITNYGYVKSEYLELEGE